MRVTGQTLTEQMKVSKVKVKVKQISK